METDYFGLSGLSQLGIPLWPFPSPQWHHRGGPACSRSVKSLASPEDPGEPTQDLGFTIDLLTLFEFSTWSRWTSVTDACHNGIQVASSPRHHFIYSNNNLLLCKHTKDAMRVPWNPHLISLTIQVYTFKWEMWIQATVKHFYIQFRST